MDDIIATRLHALERGQAIHAVELEQLRDTDARIGSLTKWALPILLSLHLAAHGWIANEVRALVSIVSRIEERMSATDQRVKRIEQILPSPPLRLMSE